MCIKTETTKKLLTKLCDLKEIGESSFNDNALAKTYAEVYVLKKELEQYEDAIKQMLIERKINNQMFPELEKKVLLTEGNKLSIINSRDVYIEMAADGIGPLFSKITKIVKANVEQLDADDTVKIKINGIIQKNTEVVSGKKTIKVLKMTKKELAE